MRPLSHEELEELVVLVTLDFKGSGGTLGASLDEDGEDGRDEARLEASDGNLEAVRLDALLELEARLEALDGALVDGSLD